MEIYVPDSWSAGTANKKPVALPSGDYMSRSRNVRYVDQTLTAEIKDKSGCWDEAELKDVSLMDFITIKETTHATFVKQRVNFWEEINQRKTNAQFLPNGNWIKKARRFELKGDILKAEIKDFNDEYQPKQIKVHNGFEVNANFEGKLVQGNEELMDSR